MPNAITHFEIYGEQPQELAQFYRAVFGWKVEQAPGVDYWCVETGGHEAKSLNGGLMYRAVSGLNGWMLYINVDSLDYAVEEIRRMGGRVVRPKTAVPKTAWVTIVSDPQGNTFGVWQADPRALPLPEPD